MNWIASLKLNCRSRIKFEFDWNWIWVELDYIETPKQAVDIFTKYVQQADMVRHMATLGYVLIDEQGNMATSKSMTLTLDDKDVDTDVELAEEELLDALSSMAWADPLP